VDIDYQSKLSKSNFENGYVGFDPDEFQSDKLRRNG
jgi:hypothetical protein